MIAKSLSENDRMRPKASELRGGLSKQGRLHLRRPVRSRLFESYVRDLHEMIGLWKAGEISDLILREVLFEMTKAIDALDVNYELYTHLQRAHIVLLDNVLRAVHDLDDPVDEAAQADREQEEIVEKKVISAIDRANNQNSAAKTASCPA